MKQSQCSEEIKIKLLSCVAEKFKQEYIEFANEEGIDIIIY